MDPLLTFPSQLILGCICLLAMRRVFLSRTSNWTRYAATAALSMNAMLSLVVFANETPASAPPILAGTMVMVWLVVRAYCARRRLIRESGHHSFY